MNRLLLPLLVAVTGLMAGTRDIPSPAGPGAMGPALSSAPDGTALLSWLEPAADGRWFLKFSRFESASGRWAAPVAVAQGADWFVNWADFPSITALSDDDLMAVWFVENPSNASSHGGHHGAGYHAEYALSHDRGATWSRPQPATGESRATEFTTVLALGENGRGLVAWLDGRQRPAQDQMSLYAQTFLAGGSDALVDPRVCDCCQLSLVRIPGEALLAYRGRSADEVRDIRLARWNGERWERPAVLHDDGWKINACPVNGPRLASRGGNVVAAWYTAAQENPRVQVKFSSDAGATWTTAYRIDRGRPQGRVDCILRDDGSALVTWLELEGTGPNRAGGIYAQVVTPAGPRGEPTLLAATKATRASGFPRLVALPGARALLAFTLDEEPSRIATLLLDPK